MLGVLSVNVLGICNLHVQTLFQRLKTIATLVNYKCKNFIKLSPAYTLVPGLMIGSIEYWDSFVCRLNYCWCTFVKWNT